MAQNSCQLAVTLLSLHSPAAHTAFEPIRAVFCRKGVVRLILQRESIMSADSTPGWRMKLHQNTSAVLKNEWSLAVYLSSMGDCCSAEEDKKKKKTITTQNNLTPEE